MKGAVLRLRTLRWDGSGVAAVEFGLLAPVWIALLVFALDFAEAFYLKTKLAAATNAAGQYAFLNAQMVTPTSVAAFLANVRTVAQTVANLSTAPVVTVLFNNATDNSNGSNYYCVSGSSPPVFTSKGTSIAWCDSPANSVVSGKYVTITVTGTMATFFPSDPVLGATISVTDAAVVRFQ